MHAVVREVLDHAGIAVRQAEDERPATVLRAITEADAVITRTGLDAAAMDAAPRLAVIGVHGSGFDGIDVAHASRLGIPVVSTPGANARAVAEHAVALMLALAKGLVAADREVRQGSFAYRYTGRIIELGGRTLGIVGLGAIGRETARLGRALGMRVLAYSPSAPDAALAEAGAERAAGLDALLREADVVSLHCPVREDTRNIIDDRALRQMRPSAFLINTSRGELVDEDALVAALREGRLAGAGLDVFAVEPLPPDHPLPSLPQVVLTPHAAGSSEEAMERVGRMVAEQVAAVLSNERPPHLVNPQAWPHRRRPA